MNISFVIPVLNGEKYIRQCIDSIVAESEEQDEIVIVDNGSTDDTVGIINTYKNVGLLICPQLTVSALRNQGAKESSKTLLAFIDADCVLGKDWRKRVMSVMSDEAVHAAGSLVDVPGEACWIEKAWFAQKPNEKRQAKYINTANLIVRRSVFEDLGGFNKILISDEDCEFGERLNKAGYGMLEDPEIRVVHLDNPTTLRDFYLREKWHATSALAGQTLKTLDRPTMMSILFGISVLLSFVFIVAAILVDVNLLWFALSVLFVPLITAIYRAYQFKKYRYIPELTILWWIFYLVRIKNMASHLLETFARKVIKFRFMR